MHHVHAAAFGRAREGPTSARPEAHLTWSEGRRQKGAGAGTRTRNRPITRGTDTASSGPYRRLWLRGRPHQVPGNPTGGVPSATTRTRRTPTSQRWRLSGAARSSATDGVGSVTVWGGGRLQDRHLMEQPMLGRCGSGTGSPASTWAMAAPSCAPVTGLPLPGVDSSNAPR